MELVRQSRHRITQQGRLHSIVWLGNQRLPVAVGLPLRLHLRQFLTPQLRCPIWLILFRKQQLSLLNHVGGQL